MFTFHPHGNSAIQARAAESHLHPHHHAPLRVARLAVEIAMVVSALALWGLLAAHRPPAPPWSSGEAPCVHFGRAGGHCSIGEGASTEAGPKCQSMGRAGRFCPPGTP